MKERTVTEKEKDIDKLSEKERAVVEKGKSSPKGKSNKGSSNSLKETSKGITNKEGQESDKQEIIMKTIDNSAEKSE